MSFEAEALRGIFSDLVARLKPDNIVDKLYEAKLLTQAEYESLISREMKSDVRGVNRRILLAVSKGPVGSVVTFAEIVKSNDQSELAGEILRAHVKASSVQARRLQSRSVSTSGAIALTREDVAMKHTRDDGGSDVTQSCSPLSSSNKPFLSTFESSGPVTSSTGCSIPLGDRVAALEKNLEVAYSRIEEQSSRMEEQSYQIEELSSKLEPDAFQTAPLLRDGPTLHSEALPDLPIPTACATAVIIGRKVYVCGGRCPDVESSRRVLVYDIDKSVWSTLPGLAPQYRCQAVTIGNQLVLTGGLEPLQSQRDRITDLVSTWTGRGWQQAMPPMPTKRCRHSAVAHGTMVAVAGGRAEDNRTLLNSVDVLNTTTCQWSTPASLQLPQPMYAMTLTANSIHINVAAARIDDPSNRDTKMPSKRVWRLPVSALTAVTMSEDRSPPCQWTEIEPTPNFDSAVLQGSPHILSIGGDDESDQATTHVAVCSHNTWATVGQLRTPRARCAIVTLSASSILVCGGYSDTRNKSTLLNSVELLSVHR